MARVHQSFGKLKPKTSNDTPVKDYLIEDVIRKLGEQRDFYFEEVANSLSHFDEAVAEGGHMRHTYRQPTIRLPSLYHNALLVAQEREAEGKKTLGLDSKKPLWFQVLEQAGKTDRYDAEYAQSHMPDDPTRDYIDFSDITPVEIYDVDDVIKVLEEIRAYESSGIKHTVESFKRAVASGEAVQTSPYSIRDAALCHDASVYARKIKRAGASEIKLTQSTPLWAQVIKHGKSLEIVPLHAKKPEGPENRIIRQCDVAQLGPN